jgi:hypothetical protein
MPKANQTVTASNVNVRRLTMLHNLYSCQLKQREKIEQGEMKINEDRMQEVTNHETALAASNCLLLQLINLSVELSAMCIIPRPLHENSAV